jgi:nicotinate-nucleotide adenylyltransferase
MDYHLLIGSDCLPDLAHWREPTRIAQLACLLIWERPGWPLWPVEQLRATLGLPAEAALRLHTARGPQVNISSRDLRARAAQGHTLRYLVPRAVECYIENHRLYGSESKPPL